ncbi:MAG TPA: ABC transporter permease [Aggregatilineales bacterium]|nr:ABC transporter permease [Aggregatilineales bacterium]
MSDLVIGGGPKDVAGNIIRKNAPVVAEIEYDQGKINRDMLIRRIGKVGMAFNPIFAYFFLWAPIVILIVYSFNAGESVSVWRGFTTQWYQNIFSNAITAGTESARFSTQIMLDSVGNSMIVAFFSTLISTVIGTMVAMSLVRGNFPGKSILDAVLYLPVVIPEITQAISLAVFFRILFEFVNNNIEGVRATTGFGAIVIGHVAFSISYVTIVVRARLADMNPRFEEAANDLGANNWRTFWRVTFPLLLPAIIAGGLLAFTLSLDDFIVTFFLSGIGTTTLPIFVYGLLKTRVPPEINAISTLMLLASTVLVGISLIMQGRNASGSKK